MLKKEITYENFDGDEVTETFYFALNRAEMAELEVTFGDEGLEAHFKKAVASGDRGKIFSLYKHLLSRMVGRREGSLFIKDESIQKAFLYSGAYDAMFVELFQHPEQILVLFREALPKKSQAAFDQHVAQSEMAGQGVLPLTGSAPPMPAEPPQAEPLPTSTAPKFDLTDTGVEPMVEKAQDEIKPPADNNVYTVSELIAMPEDHIFTLFGRDHKKWPRPVMNAMFQKRMSTGTN